MIEGPVGEARSKQHRSDNLDPVDVRLGMVIRARRHLLGLSQAQVGQALGLSFQAVQKYESGHIRVAVSTLWRLAQVLKTTPVSIMSELEPKNSSEGKDAVEIVEDAVLMRLSRELKAIPLDLHGDVLRLLHALALAYRRGRAN